MNINQIVKEMAATRENGRPYNWEPFMRKYNCDIICEIGVQTGGNFSQMIKHNPKIAVAIDPWIDDGVLARNDGGYTQEVLNKQCEIFKESVQDKPFVKLYCDYSFNAVKNFEDNYFDLVYVDGDHTRKGCLRDLTDWYPKVKKGKFLMGDDYRISRNTRVSFRVIEAVNEFSKKNNVDFFELPQFGWMMIKKESLTDK